MVEAHDTDLAGCARGRIETDGLESKNVKIEGTARKEMQMLEESM